MTPCQKIMREIVSIAVRGGIMPPAPLDTPEHVEDAYMALSDADNHHDIKSEYRVGQVETDIDAPSSRHHESRSVAAKMIDGTWVGWTYWYGGGKHGEPGSVPWMEDAYELDMTEEVKSLIVQTFTKKGGVKP